jgi:anti-anti-sigma factor
MITLTPIEKSYVWTIYPMGEIVSHSFLDIEQKIMKGELAEKKLAFNMEKVDFIDSQGIVFLLKVSRIVEKRNGKLVIYNMNHNVRRVLKRLQLDRILNIYDDVEECVLDFIAM